MKTNQMERAAYIAAYRLLTTDLTAPELACPGARRSATLDKMAQIIMGVYEAHNQLVEEAPALRLLNAKLPQAPRGAA